MKPPDRAPATPQFQAAFKEWRLTQAAHEQALERLQEAGPHLSSRALSLIDDVKLKGILVDMAIEQVMCAAQSAT